LTDWDFGPGTVPTVQPGDIRNALKVLQPIRQSGRKGIFGDPRLRAGCDPSSNVPAVWMRTNLLLVALDQEVLAKWREPGTLLDRAFEVIAMYPITCRDDRTVDFDMDGFITALEASG
jgi:hypothetical protein